METKASLEGGQMHPKRGRTPAPRLQHQPSLPFARPRRVSAGKVLSAFQDPPCVLQKEAQFDIFPRPRLLSCKGFGGFSRLVSAVVRCCAPTCVRRAVACLLLGLGGRIPGPGRLGSEQQPPSCSCGHSGGLQQKLQAQAPAGQQ